MVTSEQSTGASSPTATLALDLRSVDKHFGGTKALRGASLAVRPGTVHALLGGNGSGKSTAIKILAGVYEADAGELAIFGESHPLMGYTSTTAAAAGLRFVHQDLGLFEDLSIEENFALDAGYPRNALGGVRWNVLRRPVAKEALDLRIVLGTDVETAAGEGHQLSAGVHACVAGACLRDVRRQHARPAPHVQHVLAGHGAEEVQERRDGQAAVVLAPLRAHPAGVPVCDRVPAGAA